MLSVKKLEDTVQCKWSIDYKGFLKCALKRNENAEGAQRRRGCSREAQASLDFRTFSTHILKKLCKIIMLSVFIYTACKSCKGG